MSLPVPLYFIYFLLIFLLFSYCYCKAAKLIFSDHPLSFCLPTVWTYWISKINKFDIVWCKISISLVTFHFLFSGARNRTRDTISFTLPTGFCFTVSRFWTFPWGNIAYLLLNSLQLLSACLLHNIPCDKYAFIICCHWFRLWPIADKD